MICPHCLKEVEAVTGSDWLDLILSLKGDEPIEEQTAIVLHAIRAWSESQMYVSHKIDNKELVLSPLGSKSPSLFDRNIISQRSAMPTELRDALYNLMCALGLEERASKASMPPKKFSLPYSFPNFMEIMKQVWKKEDTDK